MTTVKEEWGLCCPNCGKDDGIDIAATVWIRMTPGGSDTEASFCGDHTYDPDHDAACQNCGFEGLVSDFQVKGD